MARRHVHDVSGSSADSLQNMYYMIVDRGESVGLATDLTGLRRLPARAGAPASPKSRRKMALRNYPARSSTFQREL